MTIIKQEDILKPLIFLDIFDYPLTAFEVWQFLGVRAELGEVNNVLFPFCHPREGGDPGSRELKLDSRWSLSSLANGGGNDNAWGVVSSKNGFYFLSGREELIAKRREFFHLAEKKFKIAKRAAWLLHFIPSVKMIALCNNFYYRPESDIDFFIITAPGRLWLTRFFATVLLDLFHLRARGKKTADKVCLSFYLSEDSLNLENIALKSVPLLTKISPPCEGGARGGLEGEVLQDDPYLAYWLVFLEPIYGQECYNRFWEANDWLKKVFPNLLPKVPVARRRIDGAGKNQPRPSATAFALADTSGTPPRRGIYLFSWLEKVAKNIQWRKLSPKIKEMAALGDTRVVINDKMLKFHENDRREFFREKFKSSIFNYQPADKV